MSSCLDCRKKNTCPNAFNSLNGCQYIELTDEANYYYKKRQERLEKKDPNNKYKWLLED